MKPLIRAKKTRNQAIKKKKKAEHYGRFAEALAKCLYRCQGYKLLETRYKNPLGEIDLIFEKARTLIYVEVKFRSDQSAALYSIDTYQINRIRRGAEWFLMKNPKRGLFDQRFDFIVFSKWKMTWIKNAF